MTSNPPTTVHIINHTHWDREWFLTSVYTSRWIPRLIDKLEQLVALNPDYRFLLDGQTLVVEDLLEVSPEYRQRIGALIGGGNLIIGPYYCQPDWQLTSGELLIRNLIYGQQDVQEYGSRMTTGWLVDTFGHISQSPQIHRLFDIDAVYVWRGVPWMEPYFYWQGPDGSRLLTINLFGGYRNLYGVSHTPEVAIRRLYSEVNKLRPYYPTADVPLFDGYDLEDDPEDPLRFFTGLDGIGSDLLLRESRPLEFAQEIRLKKLQLPTLTSELNSGKYGATFPGTLSARTYQKVMAGDCERLLLRLCEPLAVLAYINGRPYPAARYEAWGRLLLQNAVHDSICGVSIDQVHEKMEYSYRQVFEAMLEDMRESLGIILREFAPGSYAVSTQPYATDGWQTLDQELVRVRTDGIGLWPLGERVPVEAVDEAVASFTWRNAHYDATVDGDGEIRVGAAILGRLVVSTEHGDTYSDEPGERLGVIRPDSALVIEERSAHHCIVRYHGELGSPQEYSASATVRLQFDSSPMIRWQIDLDTRGTDLRVELVFETANTGDLSAGMPFDLVQRAVVDRNLLPRQLSDQLAKVLLGQRELGAVSTFPFHEFIVLSGDVGDIAIFARSLHAYSAEENGTVRLLLRRAVEWLTRSDLRDRVGDAGPFLYVPDARCERTVRHEVAVAFGTFSAGSLELYRLNAAYQNPPLIVHSRGHGTRTAWQFLREDVPMSSLHLREQQSLARFYNPTTLPLTLSHSYLETDVWGEGVREISTVQPKEIATLQVELPTPGSMVDTGDIEILTPPRWRVGANEGLPDPEIIAGLEAKIAALQTQLEETQAHLAEAHGDEKLRLQHHYFILKRESLEYRLSALLNRRKLAQGGVLGYEYLYHPDEEIAAIGLELNRMRIKRRIFDYVVQVLPKHGA